MTSPAVASLLAPSELLTRNAALYPDGVAVTYCESTISHGDLDQLANAMAHAVAGATDGRTVGVYLDRTPAWFAAYVGVQRAGKVFLPLDPAYPPERLRFMLDDAGADLIVTGRWLDGTPEDLPRIILDDPSRPLPPRADRPFVATLPDSAPAVILYTSGSTGTPKGVLRPVRALAMSARGLGERLRLTERDRFLQLGPTIHGSAVAELNMSLQAGGTLCLGRPDELTPGPVLADFMEAAGITVAQMTPSVLALVPDRPFPTVRVFSVGGEPIAPDLVKRWGCNHEFYANYGATEVTTTCGRVLTPDDVADGQVPVGPPIRDAEVLVVADDGSPALPGTLGEVWVGGLGMALGYLGGRDPGRFVPHPSGTGDRVYRTGDFGFLNPDGDLVLVGRRDDQVQIGGVRVELGEVRQAALAHPDVDDAAVAGHPGPDGVTRVALYFVAAPSASPTPGDIATHLRNRLPEAFVPTFIVPLSVMPMTPTGKLDREALPDPTTSTPSPDEPGTHVEGLVREAWARALGTVPALDVPFLEAGGTSLASLRALAELEKETGVRLTLEQLISAEGIGTLASIVEKALDDGLEPAGSSGTGAAVIPLQPDGHRTPVFFIPGINGTVPGIRHLARRIGRGSGDHPDRPVLGLQPGGVADPARLRSTMAGIVQDYIDAIESVRPMGPLLLLGFSAGAGFAREVGRCLEERGRRVSFLGLLDGKNPAVGPRPWSPRTVARTVANMPRGILSLRHGGRRRVSETARRLQERAHRARHDGATLAFLDDIDPATVFADAGWPDEIRRLAGTHYLALLRHGFPPWNARLTVFPARIRPFLDRFPPDLGWADGSAGVQVVPVPGYHVGLVERPWVREVGRVIRNAIDRADPPAA